jgi:hypothetical protein
MGDPAHQILPTFAVKFATDLPYFEPLLEELLV